MKVKFSARLTQLWRDRGAEGPVPPLRRLFQHFALTRAFVEAADPQIVNGSSSWPSRSRSAPAGSVAAEEGRGATKTSPVRCGVAADDIDYLSSSSNHCGEAQGPTTSEQWSTSSPNNSAALECCLAGFFFFTSSNQMIWKHEPIRRKPCSSSAPVIPFQQFGFARIAVLK